MIQFVFGYCVSYFWYKQIDMQRPKQTIPHHCEPLWTQGKPNAYLPGVCMGHGNLEYSLWWNMDFTNEVLLCTSSKQGLYKNLNIIFFQVKQRFPESAFSNYKFLMLKSDLTAKYYKT